MSPKLRGARRAFRRNLDTRVRSLEEYVGRSVNVRLSALEGVVLKNWRVRLRKLALRLGLAKVRA